MNVLALEVSTSSAKALIYSSEGEVKKIESMQFEKDVCDIMSQEPEGIYKALKKCVAKIVNQINEDIDAVGISTTWHSILFLNKEHEPIGKIYTWAHNKAAEIVDRYKQDLDFKKWYYKKTGCMIHSTYPLWQYIYFRDIKSPIHRKDAYISSQQTFIFEKLTGEFVMSKTTAAGSGFLNINNLTWDEEILDFSGVKVSQLPALKEPIYTAPLKKDVALELNLKPGIPVVLGGADGAMNQIGDGAVRKGLMTFSVGTSGALRMISTKPLLPEEPSTWCYYLDENKWIAGAATSGACNCLDWFVENNGIKYDDMETKLDSVEKNEAPFFLPFLYGERCPGWQDDRRGGFFNLHARHDISDMYYAILEGILFNLYHCYKILTKEIDSPSRVIISGGIKHSKKWLQMAADIFQVELVLSQVQHASLLGTAVLTLKALGEISKLQDYKPLYKNKITPRSDFEKVYQRRFETYLEIYSKI